MKKGEYYLLYGKEIVLILSTKQFILSRAMGSTKCIQTEIIRECFPDPHICRKIGMIGGTSIKLLKNKGNSKKISRLKVELIK